MYALHYANQILKPTHNILRRCSTPLLFVLEVLKVTCSFLLSTNDMQPTRSLLSAFSNHH
jgi:hypothetical protein